MFYSQPLHGVGFPVENRNQMFGYLSKVRGFIDKVPESNKGEGIKGKLNTLFVLVFMVLKTSLVFQF